jgi:L-arabinokinase
VVPPEIAFWGIDSGLRHAVSGSDYTSVRVGAFMGYRIVAELAGFRVRFDDGRGVVQVDDPRYGGYLANLSPSEFAQHYATHLPRQILGKDFLAAYSGTTDSVTKVEPDRTYAVFEPTQHPIGEHFRVRVFAELLPHAGSERARELLGELMYQSHASYSACGLGSDGTDLLVELVRRAGPRAGLHGAKITGGGSGGTVAVLGAAGAGGAVARIAEQYAEQTGRHAAIFSGSSEGAAAFGATALVAD